MAETLRDDIFEFAGGTSQNHAVRVLEQLAGILKDSGTTVPS